MYVAQRRKCECSRIADCRLLFLLRLGRDLLLIG